MSKPETQYNRTLSTFFRSQKNQFNWCFPLPVIKKETFKIIKNQLSTLNITEAGL